MWLKHNKSDVVVDLSENDVVASITTDHVNRCEKMLRKFCHKGS